MPEFVLDTGSQQAAAAFAQLDAFTRGYLEAAFFTECHADNPELDGATIADLAPEALASAIADCAAFQAEEVQVLSLAYDLRGYEPEQAGRDFWFTRNGHGVGFWDREALEARPLGYPQSLGVALSDTARNAGAVDMYRGDNGQIYFS